MDRESLKTVIESWTSTLGPAVAFLSALVTVVMHFSDRFAQRRQKARELQWRRIEFLTQAGKELDGDPRARPFMRFCDSLQPVDRSALRAALTGELSASGLSSFTEFSESLEFVLRFFSRMRMAIETGALSLAEARMYTGYLAKILETEELREFCAHHGYHDVLKLGQDVFLHASREAPRFWDLMTYEGLLSRAAAGLPRWAGSRQKSRLDAGAKKETERPAEDVDPVESGRICIEDHHAPAERPGQE